MKKLKPQEPLPKIYKRRCPFCHKQMQSTSEQILVKKYYICRNKCKEKIMTQVAKEIRA